MKKTFLAIFAVSGAICASSFAQTLGSKEPISSAGQSHEITLESPEPQLLPECDYSDAIKKFVFGGFSEKMGHAYEKLYTVPKSAFPKDVTIQDASSLMRSISKMQGMIYYSNTKGKWEVLYKEAFRVDGEHGAEPVPDLTEGSADGKTIYAFMVDHSFGKCWYRIKYRQSKNQLVMFMENRSAIQYGIVRAVMTGDFKMCATVIDNGDSFTVYMCDYSEFNVPKMLKERINKSFEARLEAIYLWFTKLGEK